MTIPLAIPFGAPEGSPDRRRLVKLSRFDATISGFSDWLGSGGTAQTAVVFRAARCNARAALLLCGASGTICSLPAEGMAMTTDIGSARDGMTWLKGHTYPRKTSASRLTAKLVLLPVAVIIGIAAWTMLPGPSDAEIQPLLARSQLNIPAQTTSWFNPAITPTETTLVTPVQEIVPPDATAADGLKISSQSWRRGGLGSNALVTFTLRNSNDYAVRDIEISCAFTRRDGSHLTDRTRTIHDIVNMKSRKKFARMHIGFVNVYADRAKCSPVTASRI